MSLKRRLDKLQRDAEKQMWAALKALTDQELDAFCVEIICQMAEQPLGSEFHQRLLTLTDSELIAEMEYYGGQELQDECARLSRSSFH